MKPCKAPASSSNFFYVVLECESGKEMDDCPRLYAVCKNEKEAKAVVKKAIDDAKETREDGLIYNYEEMDIHAPDYSYHCVYDYVKIDCKDYLSAHRRDWERNIGLLATTIQ